MGLSQHGACINIREGKKHITEAKKQRGYNNEQNYYYYYCVIADMNNNNYSI